MWIFAYPIVSTIAWILLLFIAGMFYGAGAMAFSDINEAQLEQNAEKLGEVLAFPFMFIAWGGCGWFTYKITSKKDDEQA